MIPLLDKLRTLRERSRPLLGPRSLRLLEWPAVAAQVAAFCRNDLAAAAVRARVPTADGEYTDLIHVLGDEMKTLLDRTSGLPLVNVGAGRELLQRGSPLRLDGADLVRIGSLAADLDVWRDFLIEHRRQCPVWGDAAVSMASVGGLSSTLSRALEPDGRIADGASGRLAGLRRRVGEAEREVRREVNATMARARSEGWTTGDEVTLRGDRFCIPLRSGDSTRVQGIVHDRSATGATLFVEPAAVVSRANALVETRLEIAAEEARILLELNRAVEAAAPALLAGIDLMLLADETAAARKWSLAVGGRRPALDPHGRLRIRGGRHPLLLAALGGDLHGNTRQTATADILAAGREKVVALDLDLAPSQRALVISGPNAGGKSVALKTVGVFCGLAWCGWDVPAADDTILPLVTRVLADLGDDQSISEALSSFSAHLGHLSRFLELADDKTLVLCDEIGSGTDPQEGTALAFAVLEQLVARGARVLASTHYGLLKAAVHDHPRMLNAAMDYDEQDLRPLFTLRVGDPGTSHAFDIAARMGLPGDLLERARAMAGTERVQVEKLLADLDRRARELAVSSRELEQERARLAVLNGELEKRLAGISKERREILAAARAESEKLAREGRRAIENAVRAIKSSGADKAVVRSARDRVAALERPDQDGSAAPAGDRPVLKVGQRVRIPHLNLIGRVVEIRGRKVVAVADHLRLTLGLDGVLPLEGETNVQDVPATADGGGWSWQGEAPTVPPEIDLRGRQGAEAWELLDRLIDRAIPAGLEVLNVIHGFGTGRLRDYLYEKLRQDPRVASLAEAGPGRGGGGATLVYLAES